MSDSKFTILKLSDVDSKIRSSAIQIFINCFPVYKRISKDKNTLMDFFLSSFDFNLSYVAVVDTMAVGFLAISNGKERSLKFNKAKCIELFGKVMGTVTYHEMMFILVSRIWKMKQILESTFWQRMNVTEVKALHQS